MKTFKNYDVSKYKADPQYTSFAQRVAHFLDWGARQYPGTFFAPTVILQAIMGYTKAPRSNSSDLNSIKNAMFGAQKYLMTQYKRGLVSESQVGVRATQDSEDVMRNTVTKKAMRFNGARVQLGKALDIVDPKTIPNTDAGKQLKAYYTSLKDSTKSLFSPDFEKRLLPPASPEKEASQG